MLQASLIHHSRRSRAFSKHGERITRSRLPVSGRWSLLLLAMSLLASPAVAQLGNGPAGTSRQAPSPAPAAPSGGTVQFPSLPLQTPMITNQPGTERTPNPREVTQALEKSKSAERTRSDIAKPDAPRRYDVQKNEFQDLVTQSLGISLPLYGQNLFDLVPDTFAPVDRIPATPDYVVGPGDEILIRGWGQVDIDYRAVGPQWHDQYSQDRSHQRRRHPLPGPEQLSQDPHRPLLSQFRAGRDDGRAALDPGLRGGAGVPARKLYRQLPLHSGERAL